MKENEGEGGDESGSDAADIAGDSELVLLGADHAADGDGAPALKKLKPGA